MNTYGAMSIVRFPRRFQNILLSSVEIAVCIVAVVANHTCYRQEMSVSLFVASMVSADSTDGPRVI